MGDFGILQRIPECNISSFNPGISGRYRESKKSGWMDTDILGHFSPARNSFAGKWFLLTIFFNGDTSCHSDGSTGIHLFIGIHY